MSLYVMFILLTFTYRDIRIGKTIAFVRFAKC